MEAWNYADLRVACLGPARSLELGGTSARAGCVEILRSDAPSASRYAATYALAFMHDEQAAPVLLDVLNDEKEDVELRGQAAEGLGNLFQSSNRDGGYLKAAKSCSALLSHPSPVVRYWCTYAVGLLQYQPALPELRRIAETDNAKCNGLSVASEARDMIALFEGRETLMQAQLRELLELAIKESSGQG